AVCMRACCGAFPAPPTRHLRPPLFPYTTLFRSRERASFLTVDSYAIRLDLTTGPETFRTETTLRLASTQARETFVDLIAASEGRSEEHTSELQSRFELVCRLLLEKKKTTKGAEG